MKVIKENVSNIYEIKKSKFITDIYKVENIDDVNKYLTDTRMKYPDATHICYGYKVEGFIKFSDDGEPGGTAGLPIIEVINKKSITNILVIVTRYFGGIKLGAGGLVRAYSRSVCDAIDKTILCELIKGSTLEINVNYDETKKLDFILKDKKIISKKFDINVTYIVNLKDEDLSLINEYNYKKIKDIYIEE